MIGKEALFEKIKRPEYFTRWDGYMNTPISWVISGDRWLADIDEMDYQGHNSFDDILNEWIGENEEYLWQVYDEWYRTATEKDIVELV